MSFKWLEMRITEEKERREREAAVQKRLPRALDELHRELRMCVEDYRAAFGAESAEIAAGEAEVHVTVRSQRTGQWRQAAQVRVQTVPAMPGFRIDNGAEPLEVHVGTLPGDKLLFKYGEQYLTMEQFTRLILDTALFPQLGE